MLVCELFNPYGVHILIPSIFLVEKNFGEEPKHALIMNETLVMEETSEHVNRLISIAEKMSVALQTRYSLVVCDTQSQYNALLTMPDGSIEP